MRSAGLNSTVSRLSACKCGKRARNARPASGRPQPQMSMAMIRFGFAVSKVALPSILASRTRASACSGVSCGRTTPNAKRNRLEVKPALQRNMILLLVCRLFEDDLGLGRFLVVHLAADAPLAVLEIFGRHLEPAIRKNRAGRFHLGDATRRAGDDLVADPFAVLVLHGPFRA